MGVTRTVFVAANNTATVQVAPAARDVQDGVNRFWQAMVGRYQTPTGPVIVSTPFGMNSTSGIPTYTQQIEVRQKSDLQDWIKKIAKDLGYSPQVLARVNAFRGTPTEIHRLAQGLVDNPPPQMQFENPDTKIWTTGDVRKLMHSFSLCIDCAGYVQQAYLRAWGRTRAQAQFRDMLNEDLSGLAARGYVRIGAVADVRPGDIVALEGPQGEVGHRTIVYDQRIATNDDLVPLAGDSRAEEFTQGGPIRALDLDSSWGSGGFYQAGGVQRRLFLYNESTQKWANTAPDLYAGWRVDISNLLYGHRLDGFYRRQGD